MSPKRGKSSSQGDAPPPKKVKSKETVDQPSPGPDGLDASDGYDKGAVSRMLGVLKYKADATKNKRGQNLPEAQAALED